MTFTEKLYTYREEFEKMPGVIVIHEFEGFKPVFMTSNGLQLLGLSLEELIAIKEDYQKLFFNRDFMGDYLQNLKSMIARDGISETYTVFHQVMIEEQFHWYAGSLKVFHADSELRPTHTITHAVPLEDYNWTMKRAQGLLEETEFARKNLKKFSGLSSREKEVLAHTVPGLKTAEIAKKLGVSAETISSHLKSIKRKLDTNSSFELAEFARAFDLL
ncbi:helix-turn-helix transcriptional regulator [Salinimicrobium sp. CDJ15-81-2]|nr:helix-turn-helix transcriptional regulator [Salinimicrobium nanhaiense]